MSQNFYDFFEQWDKEQQELQEAIEVRIHGKA